MVVVLYLRVGNNKNKYKKFNGLTQLYFSIEVKSLSVLPNWYSCNLYLFYIREDDNKSNINI